MTITGFYNRLSSAIQRTSVTGRTSTGTPVDLLATSQGTGESEFTGYPMAEAFCGLMAGRGEIITGFGAIKNPERIEKADRPCSILLPLAYQKMSTASEFGIITAVIPGPIIMFRADISIGQSGYFLYLTEVKSEQTMLTVADENNRTLSLCKFRFCKGVLIMEDGETEEQLRSRGISSTLQQIGYTLCDKPKQLIFKEIVPSNPSYAELAEAFLNSGEFGPFSAPNTEEVLSKVYGAPISGMEILNGGKIRCNLKRSAGVYDVRVAFETTFDLRVNFW